MLIVGMVSLLGWSAAATAAGPPVRCERLVFSVALAPSQPADQQLVGWLCARGAIQHKTIHMLVHGGTYDHNYWDFPLEPQTYSYVQALTAAGYATLALDRLGSGESSHPFGLDMHNGAFTLHQVIQTLRAGTLKAPGFGPVRGERIVIVGHSFGSFMVSIEAGTYGDVDGVILTSFSHNLGPGAGVARGSLYPAALDPKFAGLSLPPDYFTTIPGVRGQVFYYLPNADPDVVALDEQLKQTVSLGELQTTYAGMATTQTIRVPTLLVMGDYDLFGCAPPSCTAAGWDQLELDYFPAEACVEAAIVPDSGHDLNLHTNAPAAFDIIRQWADRRLGARSNHPAPVPCP